MQREIEGSTMRELSPKMQCFSANAILQLLQSHSSGFPRHDSMKKRDCAHTQISEGAIMMQRIEPPSLHASGYSKTCARKIHCFQPFSRCRRPQFDKRAPSLLRMLFFDKELMRVWRAYVLAQLVLFCSIIIRCHECNMFYKRLDHYCVSLQRHYTLSHALDKRVSTAAGVQSRERQVAANSCAAENPPD